ncbi:bifunctional indole-3-glycerol-phosphate synthase TrpC/phosphoribosylanthranilate isomerase TrpF [Paraferrimonas sedimenticola]|uniref:Multifunctional fusion protein n=1 Tax=Paraferrimonas sedimenticola TaxID=375674 RepID=A0AA37RUM7_9GAMM|nr:bifunctional indole-3-glycerol-phosphate synthase TrpC/phosphoribosylanthranilate isomerase TrpF [Paraferrimonas sedimenticola]GLP94927.1 bifunctional indole-3-glycerol phosphate synthase/phosphoribosylanthranilate isomerase [Paraferrimonas sedimenticola]
MIKVSAEIPSVLAKIVEDKAEQLDRLKQEYPRESLKPQVSERSLYDSLKADPAGFILECKKASPSKGLIRDDFDPQAIAKIYGKYAAGISVLTDEKYFQGRFEFLPIVRAEVNQPVLCKDFFIDEFQIDLAAHFGADAILLMLSVLDDERYQALAEHAARYQLDILTEVSNPEELTRAINLNAKIVGINNRNLRDLSTDLQRTVELVPSIPKDRVIISESGIYTNDQVRELAPLVNGFLVGSSIMAQDDLDQACRQLIFGEVKICGLDRPESAIAAETAGALYGGMIFYPKSPRHLSLEAAKAIRGSANLRFVGVFVNAEVEQMVEYANELGLFAIQLHGQEDEQTIIKLKEALPQCQIWQAIAPQEQASEHADRRLLDVKTQTQPGGSGQTLDWQSEQVQGQRPAMLAGGLTPENVNQAIAAGFNQLDINSGVESAKAQKCSTKIQTVMRQIRQY